MIQFGFVDAAIIIEESTLHKIDDFDINDVGQSGTMNSSLPVRVVRNVRRMGLPCLLTRHSYPRMFRSWTQQRKLEAKHLALL